MTDTREMARNSAWECIYHLWKWLKDNDENDLISDEQYQNVRTLFYELKREYRLKYNETFTSRLF